MNDEEEITLDTADELDLSEGLEEVPAPEPVELQDEEAFNPRAVKAFDYLMSFREAFSCIPEGNKYFPQLSRLDAMISRNRDDIKDELKRAHARGRC